MEAKDSCSSKNSLFFSTKRPETSHKSKANDDKGKNRLKALRGWDYRDIRRVDLHTKPQQMNPLSNIESINKDEDSKYIRLYKENSNLKRENEYLKKNLKETKVEIDRAKLKIEELESIVAELRDKLNEAEELPIDSIEEVKEEHISDTIKELAKKLNCDSGNEEELKSLELALRLEAEERETMERELFLQQNEALKALDNSARRTSLEDMNYEQLLDLEEKIGYISKGLPEEQIEV